MAGRMWNAAGAIVVWGSVSAAAVGQTLVVQKSGSDARARDFNARILPAAKSLVAGKLGEWKKYDVPMGDRIDASRMYLRYDSSLSVRIYLLNVVTSCTNEIGVFVKETGAAGEGTRLTVFPKVTGSMWNAPGGLTAGDFVDLGKMPQGTQLDPYFLSMCYKPPVMWSTDSKRNNDKQVHVTSFVLDDRYLIVGFEDWVDYDYQDAVVVCDFGAKNAPAFETPKLPH
jgi:hypothetical protein